jgi:UDP-N-acetylglucosamine 2-epimerase
VEKPLSYKQVIYYLKYAKLLITDSGGMQKEAFFAKTQTLTIRNETEWPETIKAKYNRLVEPKENLIYAFVKKYISFKGINSKPYGVGNTAKIVLKKIQSLKKRNKKLTKRKIKSKRMKTRRTKSKSRKMKSRK